MTAKSARNFILSAFVTVCLGAFATDAVADGAQGHYAPAPAGGATGIGNADLADILGSNAVSNETLSTIAVTGGIGFSPLPYPTMNDDSIREAVSRSLDRDQIADDAVSETGDATGLFEAIVGAGHTASTSAMDAVRVAQLNAQRNNIRPPAMPRHIH